MKTILSIVIATNMILYVLGCENTQATSDAAAETTAMANPIAGAWDLVYGEYANGEGETVVRRSDTSFQIKVFSDEHFALIMLDDEGGHAFSVSGDYSLEGNRYTETFDWILSENPANEAFKSGGKYILEWRLEGDTLYMEGPVEAYNNTGELVQQDRFLEKRVRTPSKD